MTEAPDQSAGGRCSVIRIGAHVNERFAIGHDHDFVTEQLVTQSRAQSFGAPVGLVIAAASAHVELAQQASQVARQRLHVCRCRLRKGLGDAFAAKERAHTRHPPPP